MGKWSSEKLKKLGYTYTGLSGKTLADFGEGIPYIPYMNVFSNAIINPEHLEYVRIKKHEKQNCVISGDALFTTSSETPEEVGMSSVLVDNLGTVYLNSFCFGYRLYDKEQFDSTFLAYALRGSFVRHQMFISAQGSTRHNLSKRNFNKTTLYYPVRIAEQNKIGEILATVDETIDKTRALIEKYIAVKRGLMQDMLKQGDRILLGDKKYFEVNPKRKALPNRFYYIDLEAVVSGNVIKWDIINKTSAPSRAQRLLCVNDVLFQTVRPYQQNNYFFGTEIDLPVVASTGYAQIRTNQNPIYLYYVLHTDMVIRSVLTKCTGSNYPAINSTELKRVHIILPSIEVQNEIAQKLTAADERIQSERNYLAKLLAIKKGLMHDLLTNVVSVDALLKEDLS